MTTQLFDFNDGNGLVVAHQHPNGGGWVANSANVASSAFIGTSATIAGNVRIDSNSILFGEATLRGKTKIYSNTVLYGADSNTILFAHNLNIATKFNS